MGKTEEKRKPKSKAKADLEPEDWVYTKRKKSTLQRHRVKIALGVLSILAVLLAAWFQFDSEEDFSDMKFDYPPHPDHRPPKCPTLKADSYSGRESVSIIIPYLNEEWFRIKATMQSILRHTDMSRIRELLWVADGCKPGKVFASELRALHRKVKVTINEKNLGLIPSKVNAAAQATGSILIFLEPHILVTPGWLPPMLSRIAANPKMLIMPTLDVLDEQMNYIRSTHGQWRFQWNLQIVYNNPRQFFDETAITPYMSPATSGGIYAIRKDFWDQLDFFDQGLLEWGGDHIEASHKVWRCGGRIEIHPCSRIAHWFRVETNRPYDVKVESVFRNYKRLADTWFDKYFKVFNMIRFETASFDVGDLTEVRQRRKKLEENLSCKSMDWYIKNVDLELGFEVESILKNTGQTLVDRKVRSSKVNCGGHVASECSDCSQGNGAMWCNGDCEWKDSACVAKPEEASSIALMHEAMQRHGFDGNYDRITPAEYKRRSAVADAFK